MQHPARTLAVLGTLLALASGVWLIWTRSQAPQDTGLSPLGQEARSEMRASAPALAPWHDSAAQSPANSDPGRAARDASRPARPVAVPEGHARPTPPSTNTTAPPLPSDSTTLNEVDQLGSRDAEVRAAAVDNLGFSDDPAAEPYVISTLVNDPVAEVRAAAAAALETHADSPDAVRSLTAALSDPSQQVREHALLSLSAIRNTAVEAELRQRLAGGTLAHDTADAVRVFLDRYYPRRDPLADFTRP